MNSSAGKKNWMSVESPSHKPKTLWDWLAVANEGIVESWITEDNKGVHICRALVRGDGKILSVVDCRTALGEKTLLVPFCAKVVDGYLSGISFYGYCY